MKKLALNIVILFAIVASLAAIFSAANQYLFSVTLPKLDKDIKYVSIGSSISQYALSDSIIPNFKNLSLEGRTGISTWKSSKAILEANPELEGVIVDFSVLGMVGYRDYSFLLPIFANSELAKVYPITSYKELNSYPINPKYALLDLMHHEWTPNLDYISCWWRQRKGESCQTDVFPYLGQYKPKDIIKSNVNTKELNRRINALRFISGDEYPISTIDVAYADSLVKVAQESNIELILFLAPIQDELLDLIPQVYLDSIESYIQRLKLEDKVISFDFRGFEMPDSCFINFTHFNIYGSKLLSEALTDSLDLLENSKQEDGI